MDQLSWHRRFLENVAGNAAWAVLAALGSAIVPWKKLMSSLPPTGARLLVGLFLMALGVLGWCISNYYAHRFREETKRLNEKLAHAKPWLIAKMLRLECNLLLRSYRGLLGALPGGQEIVRFPLANTSWPSEHASQTWTFAQLRMYCLYEQFDNFTDLVYGIAQEMEWTEYAEILHLDRQTTSMLELIAALENLDRVLETKDVALLHLA